MSARGCGGRETGGDGLESGSSSSSVSSVPTGGKIALRFRERWATGEEGSVEDSCNGCLGSVVISTSPSLSLPAFRAVGLAEASLAVGGVAADSLFGVLRGVAFVEAMLGLLLRGGGGSEFRSAATGLDGAAFLVDTGIFGIVSLAA